MPRPPRNGNGNGNGHHPPPDEPQDGQPEGGDDPQEQIVAYIRAIVTGELDQRMGVITSQFEQVNSQFGQVANALNQLNDGMIALKNHIQGQPAQVVDAMPPGDHVGTDGRLGVPPAAATPAPMPQIGGNPVFTALATAAVELLSKPEAIAGLFQSFAQAKASLRPPDIDDVLRSIAQTSPQKLYAYVPDPLGGRFPEIITNAVQTGIRIGATGKMGAYPFPLADTNNGASGAPSESQPKPSSQPAPSAASLSLESLSDDEIEAGIAMMMRTKMARQSA